MSTCDTLLHNVDMVNVRIDEKMHRLHAMLYLLTQVSVISCLAVLAMFIRERLIDFCVINYDDLLSPHGSVMSSWICYVNQMKVSC